jgi:hypothetical protein
VSALDDGAVCQPCAPLQTHQAGACAPTGDVCCRVLRDLQFCDRLQEIDLIVELLRDAWRATPDLRLGQLLHEASSDLQYGYSVRAVRDGAFAADLFLWRIRNG